MQNKTEQAFAYLLQHVQSESRCVALPHDLQPETRAEAYAIQAHCELQSASPLRAWKIAATSIAGQKHIGVSGPLAGRYVSERVVATGASIPFGNNHMKVAEVEFAFRLGHSISPRNHPYTEVEVMDAVETLCPAIEIPDSRYEAFEMVGECQLIADNACAHWLALGEHFPERWRNLDLATLKPKGRITGRSETIGSGSNVLGSPRIAMTWLINELSSLGITAKSGQFVTTGTCIIPMAITAGSHIEGDFGDLGGISLYLA